MPKRIQLRRTAGWRKPDGAIVVSRPSKWGNPFIADSSGVAVHRFREWLSGRIRPDHLTERRRIILRSLSDLRGHDLCCWCPLDKPCHADVLIELANS